MASTWWLVGAGDVQENQGRGLRHSWWLTVAGKRQLWAQPGHGTSQVALPVSCAELLW